MTTTIGGTTGITFPDATTQNTSPYTGGLAFRNRIINGAMQVDQRNAGASVTPASGNYTLDRWQFFCTQASKLSVQQRTPGTSEFVRYAALTSLSAYSITASDTFGFRQIIEGVNVADFGFGTANAKTVTLSFQVYSSLTGTFGGSIINGAGNRSYPFTFSISSANTWTSIAITIPGDTSGTWATDNTAGLQVVFSMGSGSTYSGTAGAWASGLYYSATGATSVVGTNGATFYITGVQLEKGSTATSFDYRPYGTELALCQRYYAKAGFGSVGCVYSGNGMQMGFPFPVTMRSAPTVTITTSTPSFSMPGTVGDRTGSGSTMNYYQASTLGGRANIDGFTGLTTNGVSISMTDFFAATAEL